MASDDILDFLVLDRINKVATNEEARVDLDLALEGLGVELMGEYLRHNG